MGAIRKLHSLLLELARSVGHTALLRSQCLMALSVPREC